MIETKPYSFTRSELSRLTALYYLRTFWFVFIGPFLFGIILMIFGPNQTTRVFGLVFAGWPGTVFVRSLLLTKKNAQAWVHPTVMSVREDGLYFESQTEPIQRVKVRFESIRRTIPILGYLLFQTRRFGFIPLKESALADPKHRDEIVQATEKSPLPDGQST